MVDRDDDDDSSPYCSCPSDVDEEEDFMRHRSNCLLRYGKSTPQQLALFRTLKRQAAQQRRRRRRSVDEDDNYLGEYIPESYDLRRQRLNLLNQINAPTIQIGRGFGAVRFKLKKKSLKKSLKNGVEVKEHRVNLLAPANHVPSSTPLGDVLTSLGVVLDQIVDEAIVNASGDDRIQILIYTIGVDGTMIRPVSTKPFPVSLYEKERALALIENYIIPYDEVSLGDDIHVETILIRKEEPGDVVFSEDEEESGAPRKFRSLKLKRPLGMCEAKAKSSMVFIDNELDNLCLTRAVVVGLAKNAVRKAKVEFGKDSIQYLQAFSRFENIRRSDGRHVLQTELAMELATDSGLNISQRTTSKDIEKVARFKNIEIRAIHSNLPQKVFKYGQVGAEIVYLYREQHFPETDYSRPDFDRNSVYHFHTITNIQKFLGLRFYCKKCEIGTDSPLKRFGHRCPDMEYFCYACWNRDCVVTGPFPENHPDISCFRCGIKCQSQECFERHLEFKKCDEFFCWGCQTSIKRKKKTDGTTESYIDARRRHKCIRKCRVCKKSVYPDHKCYMVREHFKKPNDRYVFLDFETDQSDPNGKHVVIYCYLKWLIVDKVTGLWDGHSIGEKEFGVHYNVLNEVGDFLFREGNFDDYTVIAHNMRGFDGCFLLNYLLEKGIEPFITSDGLKLISVKIGGDVRMRLIDSLNFLQMGLSQFPKTLGLQDVGVKGYFPHFFTCPENLQVKQTGLPPPEDYGAQDMMPSEYEKFMSWHEEHRNDYFDFQQELRDYCKQDVNILMQGCLAFRDLVMTITGSIEVPYEKPTEDDPFDTLDKDGCCDPFQYTTAPSFASAVFKAKFLKKGTIAQIRPAGYDNHLFSSVAIEYLEYLRETDIPQMKHALNNSTGEIKIGVYRVDGFDLNSQTIYEFYGCYWHGCPSCIDNRTTIHPVKGVTMEKLFNDTIEREEYFKSLGFSVVAMWECKWAQFKKENPQVNDILKNIPVKKILDPRDAFYGGRVDVGRLLYNQKVDGGPGAAYVDFNSLYPSINMFEEYPIGHPEIITSNFKSLDEYFGVISCRILPPQNMRAALLPQKINGKLLFALCKTCAHETQTSLCQHSVDERALSGTWVTEEVKYAISKGYQLLDIFCIHHFKRKSRDLFSDYIRLFYKIKVAASGNPCSSDEELQQFIEELKKKEGIEIDASEFENNSGKRSIGKLACNSLWGRMGMNENRSQCTAIFDLNELNRHLRDPLRDVHSIRRVNDKCVCINHKHSSIDCVDVSNNTNIYLAIFTTTYARLRLAELIDFVGWERVLYMDTDSLIYLLSENEEENLTVSPFLGELSSELDDDDVIVDFSTGGPKVYGFETRKGKCQTKVKGFKLDQRTSAVFSNSNLKKIIQRYIEVNCDERTGRVSIPKLNVAGMREEFFENFHSTCENISSVAATSGGISVYNTNRIRRSNAWEIFKETEQKMYTVNCSKFIVMQNGLTVPFGFVES
jgi:hypothetical protein